MKNIRIYISLVLLAVYAVSATGCAAAWFIAGAGAAATAITVSEDNKKEAAKEDIK